MRQVQVSLPVLLLRVPLKELKIRRQRLIVSGILASERDSNNGLDTNGFAVCILQTLQWAMANVPQDSAKLFRFEFKLKADNLFAAEEMHSADANCETILPICLCDARC